MTFRVGQTVGGYEFLRVLDSSESALVFEVFNHAEQRNETLKVLPREFKEDPARVERFLREVKIHAGLNHPGIAAFYQARDLEGQFVMTTERIDGVSLEQRLVEGPVSLSEAIDIADDTLAALSYAHEQRVVHREITPENIYLLGDGVIKLTGFGLAKQFEDPKLTALGRVVGPVHYLSPEQVKGASEADGRSDLYSLGIVLYEMVAGSRPFESPSQFDIIQAHVMRPPPCLLDYREDLPEQVNDVIMRALEKDPDDRFPTAQSFRESLLTARGAARALETQVKPLRIRDPMEELEPTGDSGPSAFADQLFGDADEKDAGEEEAAPEQTADEPWQLGYPEPQGPAEVEPAAAAAPAAKGWPETAAAMQAEPAPAAWQTRDLVIMGVMSLVMLASLVMGLMIALGD